MDIAIFVTLVVSTCALASSLAAIYLIFNQRRKTPAAPAKEVPNRRNSHYLSIAGMLSDGAMVWQRLVNQCDELIELTPDALVPARTRDTVGDWLNQLREFCHESGLVIDESSTLFAHESRALSAADLELRYPEMERFNKEMKSNIVVISNQLQHVQAVLRGSETLGQKPLKITLHKPQAMPHFLRRRKKIAELQARQLAEEMLEAEPAST